MDDWMKERGSEGGDVNGMYEEERWDGSEKGGDDMEGIWEEPGKARIWERKVWRMESWDMG